LTLLSGWGGIDHHGAKAKKHVEEHTPVARVERSERNVSIDNIARIAKGLRVEGWRLLHDL
jgi:hypothetical protein